jgi:recombination DNA repair RAD52 pathway protein
MGFSARQVQALRRSPDHRHIRSREANGRQLSYLEGWYAISEANRIFGFDGWSRETVETRCAVARENRGAFLAIYIAPGPDHRARGRSDHHSGRPRHW